MSRQIVLAVDVTMERTVVHDAITTEQGLASFWTSDVTASPEVGATLRFGFEPAPVDLELTLDEKDGDRVVWRAGEAWPDWRGTTMAWTLSDSPDGEGTRVLLTHDGWSDNYPIGDLGSVAYTWSLVLGALKEHVETGMSRPALG